MARKRFCNPICSKLVWSKTQGLPYLQSSVTNFLRPLLGVDWTFVGHNCAAGVLPQQKLLMSIIYQLKNMHKWYKTL